MRPQSISKLIKEASAKGHLPLERLDAILDNDAAYERNVEKLNAACHDFSIDLSTIDDHDSSPNKSRGPRFVPFYSSGQNIYFQYVSEIRKKPRMSRSDESLFSKRMEFFKRRLEKIFQETDLPAEETRFYLQNTSCIGRADSAHVGPLCEHTGACPRGKKDMVHANCQGYNKCRALFVERNLQLVVNLAQPYRTYGVPIMDLIQEGNAALIRAVEKFDWRKQVRFQTYAAFWIRQAVERAISANKGIVRVPNYLQQKMRRLKREGKIPTDRSLISARDVSEAFEMSNEVAGHLLETERGHISLDAHPSDDEHSTLTDLIAEDEAVPVLEDEIVALKKLLAEALDDLTEQERIIIRHRFGLNNAALKTLDELGEMMNVSRERIRQVQIRALQKLKKPRLLEGLQSFL